jgi:hypothetical protein
VARITSQKTRQMIFVVGEPFDSSFVPENLALYMPDGTPIDLTRDVTSMHWAGPWKIDKPYLKNDVVIDAGDLFILSAESIAAGSLSPSLENAPPADKVMAPGDAGEHAVYLGGSDASVYRLIDGQRGLPSPGVLGVALGVYFDLAVGGTVTLTDTSLANSYIEFYNSAGVAVTSNVAQSAFGHPLVITGLAAGRYYAFDREAIQSPPNATLLRVALSDGAEFDSPNPNWAVFFRAQVVSDP